MKSNKLRVSTLITILLLSFIGIVFAFWTSGVLVNDDFDDSRIDVGLAKPVESTITIAGGDATNLIPIGTIGNQDAVEFVIIPITLNWHEKDTNFAAGLKATFTISPTVILKHGVSPAVPELQQQALDLININFVTNPGVTDTEISSTLMSHSGSNANVFFHALEHLDDNLATDTFDIELTIGTERIIYLVAYIGMPNEETRLYLRNATIAIDLVITAKTGQIHPAPIIPTELVRFKTMAAGGIDNAGVYGFNVAIDEDGKLWTWGSNYNGQLGNGTSGQATYSSTPIPIDVPGVTFETVAAGSAHLLALDDEGNLWAWGSNNNYALGVSTSTNILAPTLITTPTKFKQVAAGENYSVAICVDGYLWSWGFNGTSDTTKYRLGRNTTGDNDYRPTKVENVETTKFKTLEIGNSHTIAITEDNVMWGWGNNANGQVGTPTSGHKFTPALLYNPNNVVFTKLALPCTGFSVALDKDGQIWTWGANSGYYLGDNTNINKSIPTRVTDKNSNIFIDIATVIYGVIALDDQGQLWSWGSDRTGALGSLGTADPVVVMRVPTPMSQATAVSFTAVFGGHQHALALDDQGRIWSAGRNTNGQLGDGDIVNRYNYRPIYIKKRLD